jgi:hypothetical protein
MVLIEKHIKDLRGVTEILTKNNLLEKTVKEIEVVIKELEFIKDNFVLAPRGLSSSSLRPFSCVSAVKNGDVSAHKFYQQWLIQHVESESRNIQNGFSKEGGTS